MTRESYQEHLTERLRIVDAKLAKALAQHEKGDFQMKVDSAGDLALLKAKHRELCEKIRKANEQHAENWSSLHTEFQEDIDALLETLESWITGKA